MEYHIEPERPSTIVDVLIEDCWRIILDFLDINDIIQSERVSRQWQNVILQYLQGAHFSIEYPWFSHKPCQNVRVLTMARDDPEKFYRITKKWGLYIKKADCINKACLKVIAKHCPNLEDVTFYGFHDFVLLNGAQHCFKKLKRVHFGGCQYATDKCIGQWLVNDSIEELVISSTDLVTGQCFNKLQSNNLTTLSLKECLSLEFRYLLSAADRMKGLTKLELIYVPKSIFKNVISLLDELPNLEDLCLRWEKKMMMGNEMAEAISRLGLKRLDLSFNPNANDEWLEIIARGCGRLQELYVEGCIGVTARGVLAACAAARGLRTLRVGSSVHVRDRHVEAFILNCPNLQCVDVSYCSSLTPRVVGLAAGARAGAGAARPRLRLILAGTGVERDHDYEVQYPWLDLDFGW